MDEFYRKVHKYLKLEDSNEALCKVEGEAANKKNDPRIVPDGNKGQAKTQGEDKWAKSPKKQRSGLVVNKGPPPKYTNYHFLNAPLDHIYAVTDRGLYRSPKPMKNERARRDIKRNYAFHKNVWRTTDRCVALKDEIERLIRAGHCKEFIDEPQAVNREERSRKRSPEKVHKVLTVIDGSHLAGESCNT